MATAKLAQRFLIVCLLSFWLGGLTFYAVIVVPIGAKVLGSETEQGFITQQVTNWLNIVGTSGTIILACNLKFLWRKEGIPRYRLAVTCGLMLLAQAALLILHPLMDKLLDASVHSVNEPVEFYRLHRVYLMTVTALWLGGISHLWFLLKSWQADDVTRNVS
jgi:hypothetical protein